MDARDEQSRRSDARQPTMLRVALPPLALGLWLLSARVFPAAFATGEVGRIETLILSAVTGWVFIGGLVDLLGPAPREERRAVVWLLRAYLVVPLAVLVIVSASALHGARPPRNDGALPDLVGLLGQREPEVDRLLGTATKKPLGWSKAASLVAVPPAIKGSTSVVAYSLPDLAWPAARKRTVQDLLPSFAPEPKEAASDAIVIVYFSKEGEALVAHLDISRKTASALFGPGWLGQLPSSAGLTASLETGTPPPWAESAANPGKGSVERWGSSRIGEQRIVYHLRSLKKPPSGVSSSGVGSVSLTVGGETLDAAPVAGDVRLTAQPVVDASRDAVASEESTADFSDRTFYAIILGQEQSESAAIRRADALNKRAAASGMATPAAAVERSGHLFSGEEQSWVVVYSVGYDSEKLAAERARGLWWPLRTFTSVRKVWKRCGDVTFREIV